MSAGEDPSGERDLTQLQAGQSLELGLHRLTLSGDVVRMVGQGDFSLDELIRLHRIIEVMLHRYGEAFLLVVVGKEGTVSAEGRRWVGQWNKEHHSGGAAVVGASGAIARAIFNMVVRAINLVREQPLAIALCSTEDEAHHWFAQRRRPAKSPPAA
jgi:hypothetical protein